MIVKIFDWAPGDFIMKYTISGNMNDCSVRKNEDVCELVGTNEIRLIAEMFAVLEEHQIQEMAVSMGVSVDRVKDMLSENEKKWESLKNALAFKEW